MSRWTSMDTLGDYLDGESREEQLMDDEARDLRWQAFMDWARKHDIRVVLFLCSQYIHKPISSLTHAMDEEYWPLADFAEQEKWSGVLYALAQIQQEREKAA